MTDLLSWSIAGCCVAIILLLAKTTRACQVYAMPDAPALVVFYPALTHRDRYTGKNHLRKLPGTLTLVLGIVAVVALVLGTCCGEPALWNSCRARPQPSP